jgi:hypothetical protein
MLAGFGGEIRRKGRCNIKIRLKEKDGNSEILESLMSLMIVCHVCIDEYRTRDNIQRVRSWYLEQILHWNIKVTKRVCYPRRLAILRDCWKRCWLVESDNFPSACP